ncbi:MAG: hypothetical protein IJ560_01660 [Alphaproteobacteria bacterium]|nr:hypothetical protein [Alphaproteobacteria bacterium]
MTPKASVVAQKLLNLYRQEHVIFGGWSAVNPIFVNEATADVIAEMRNLPNGKTLIAHIENLRTGRTPMNTIDRSLLPYGGLMDETAATIKLTTAEITELTNGLSNFTPDQDGLARIQSLNVVKKFGDEWLVGIRAALAEYPELIEKWAVVRKTYRAYYLWKVASDMLTTPMSERARAQLQADMPDYEMYLPMFGDAGTELLTKLRTFISSIKHPTANNDEGGTN